MPFIFKTFPLPIKTRMLDTNRSDKWFKLYRNSIKLLFYFTFRKSHKKFPINHSDHGRVLLTRVVEWHRKKLGKKKERKNNSIDFWTFIHYFCIVVAWNSTFRVWGEKKVKRLRAKKHKNHVYQLNQKKPS